MFRKFFEKNRDKIFPKYAGKWHTAKTKKDIKKIHDQYQILHMDFYDWFFFHPTAFNLLFYGINVLSLILFFVLFLIFLFKKNVVGFVIFCAIFLRILWLTVTKIKNKTLSTNYTFYELWIKKQEDDFK